MDWIIPSNTNVYNLSGAFQEWGFVDWHQGRYKFEIGDYVFLYCSRPIQKVMYKTIVEKVNLSSKEIVDDRLYWSDPTKFANVLNGKFIRLQLIAQSDHTELSLGYLLDNGLNAAPQSPIRLNSDLKNYIDRYFYVVNNDNTFPDSADTIKCFEGAKITVEVNRYERNPLIRQKCIDYYGCYCQVCGIDFEKVYGEVGIGFIHVHHIIPLSEIGERYHPDPRKDLIPVCPNCHAMLHRKVGNKNIDVEELRKKFKNKSCF